MGPMTGLDVMICAILALGGLYGLLRGFVVPFIYLASFAVAFLAARALAPLLMEAIPLAGGSGLGKAMWYGLVFLGTVLVCRMLARRLKRLIKKLHLGGVDRIAGFLAGMVAACLLILFVVALEEYYFSTPPKCLSHSTLFPWFQDVTRLVLIYLPETASRPHEKGAEKERIEKQTESLLIIGPEEGKRGAAEEIVLSWNEVEGAAGYKLLLRNGKDGVLVMELRIQAARFPMAGLAEVLEEGEYSFDVAALTEDGTEFVRSPSRFFELAR